MDKTEGKSIVKKCVLIAAGAVVYAAGMGLFLSPNHLAPGGVTGIAVILNSVFEFPTGTTAFLLDDACGDDARFAAHRRICRAASDDR